MRIWIDADAAPAAMREIVFRASRKHRVPVVLVSDRTQATPNLSSAPSSRNSAWSWRTTSRPLAPG